MQNTKCDIPDFTALETGSMQQQSNQKATLINLFTANTQNGICMHMRNETGLFCLI